MNSARKILILDDNKHVRYQVCEILSPFQCDCFEAETEDEALALITEHDFEVLFFDIRLRFGVTGIEVFRKAKEIRPTLGKVIILTGWLEDAARAEASELGAHAWLDKAPLDGEKIIEAFRSAIAAMGGELA